MAKILVRNDISAITTQNQALIKFLYENLRFRDRNYFHNRAYRQKYGTVTPIFSIKTTANS